MAIDPQWAGSLTGPASHGEAYQVAVRRSDRVVRGRDDSLNANAYANALGKAGATLFRGHGQILRPGVIDIAGTELGFGQLVVNTGASPVLPDAPGLESVAPWTSDEALSTSTYLRSVVIVGGALSVVSWRSCS